MNDLHDLLARTAESVPLTGPDLVAVRRRARSIRRRRAAGAAGGVAAAVAVVAGIGLAVASGADTTAPSIATSSSPSPHAHILGRPPAVPHHRVTQDVPAEQTSNGEPGIAYWHDGTLYAPDGSPTPMATPPSATPGGAAASADGRYRLHVGYGRPELHLKQIQQVTLHDPATGQGIASYLAPQGGFFGSYAWDGDRVLTAVYAPVRHSTPARGHGTWFLAWLGPDGYIVARSTGTPGTAGQPAYVLPNG